jgi:hypothetical protein
MFLILILLMILWMTTLPEEIISKIKSMSKTLGYER